MKIGDFEDIPDHETFVKDYYRCLAGVDENVAPTILDIAGVSVYYAMDGVSFKPLLQGKKIESILKAMSMSQNTAMERDPIMIT